MKIHIIGGSGTGKSYIANKLSQKFNIAHYDLDNIFWDNESRSYGTKLPVEKRSEKLNLVLKNDNWIIEGVYYSWLSDSFSTADYIFILTSPMPIYKYRIIKRFIMRKLGLIRSKKESINSLISLLRWTDNYQKNTIPLILQFLEPHKEKVILIKNSNDILKFFK